MTAHCTRGASITAAVLVLLLIAAGCAASPEDAGGDDRSAAVSSIASTDAVALLGADDVVVIDVRTPEEHAAGHLEGAELLDLAGGDFERRIGDYDRDATYVLYCRTGNRSAQAAAMMDDLGFVDVRDAGAYDDLATSGASTVSPDA